jgi:hypothetical protein
MINPDHIVTYDMLTHLPPAVQRYLTYSGVVGKPWIDTVSLKYTGRFRTAPDKPWMPLNVHQYYTTKPPGFLWKAHFKVAGLPLVAGSDVYKAGHSHIHGKLAGLVTVMDGEGEEVDQGTMVRYLQEMSWFPVAYLGENITWTEVDDHAAEVTFTDHRKSVTGRIYFDDLGRFLNFTAQRYGEFDGGYALQTWSTPMTEYGTFCGLRIPVAGLGVWQLSAGDFAYVDVHVTEMEYNQPIEDF